MEPDSDQVMEWKGVNNGGKAVMIVFLLTGITVDLLRKMKTGNNRLNDKINTHFMLL